MGKLFAIEGVDGAGKETQTRLLFERLAKEGYAPLRVSFPNYESESSFAVKLYLAGAFGEKAEDVGAKAASTFFALDRYISYKTNWEKDYQQGRIILADRYVTSNMIHQASKLDTDSEKDAFIDWLCGFEYGIYQLPKPDAVLSLNVPPDVGAQNTKGRKNKATGGARQDIHESDRTYLQKSYDNAMYVAHKLGWNCIDCAPDGAMRTIDDIGNEIYAVIRKYLSEK